VYGPGVSPLPSPSAPPPALRRYAIGSCVLAGVVLLQVASQYLSNPDSQRSFSVLVYLAFEIPPLMLVLSAVFARARRGERSTLYMVGVGLALAGAMGGGFGALFWWVSAQLPELGLRLFSFKPMSLERAALFGFTQGLGHLGLWTLAFALPSVLHDARVRALEAEKLRLEADRLRAAAELARLRANLEPHFLLNTLNAIAGLITEDVKEARRLLVCLGDLLRDALHDEGELQSLDAQLAWLRRYAAILETRHRGVLQFHWHVDEGLDGVLVPRLLLQPLVENAVKHGALKRPDGGEVSVRIQLQPGGTVLCTVEDNGPGIAAEQRAGGFGLQSVRRRLELRYPERSNFRIESSPEGTRSIVELPQDLAAGGGAA
jgi:signal transduction histidine kinase